MRLLKQDYKHGEVRLQIEDQDDLWYLSSVLEPGDRLKGSTERKIKLGGSEDKSKVIKRRVTLTIRVDKTDYTGEDLRALGSIIDGPDDMPRGSGHSFTLMAGDDVTIAKDEWPNYMRERLEESSKARRAVIAAMYDREQANVLLVTGRGVQELLTLKGDVSKKGLDDHKQGSFYAELVKELETLVQRYAPRAVILASPAFWQEYMKQHLTPALAKISVFTTVSDSDKTAMKELLARPEVKSLLQDARATQELGYVEEIMSALSRDRLAYGDADVKEALASAGAPPERLHLNF